MSIWRSPHDSQTQTHLGKRNALLGAIGLSLFAFVLQVAGAWYTGSLALLGDSAHLMTDLFSLIMSLTAVILASRPTTGSRSFGLYRLEVLASFMNGLLLLVVSASLAWEGVSRLRQPGEVKVGALVVVAVVGLCFNLASAFLLMRAAKDGDAGHLHHHGHDHGHDPGHHHGHDHQEHDHSDRNLHSALLHVWSDALGSVAVILGAVLIHFTQLFWIDAAVGILLAIWIFRWAGRVILESGHVLLESTPKHVKTDALVNRLRGLDQRVALVEDLHVWEITSRMYAASAEIHVRQMDLQDAERLRQQMNKILRDEFGIAHVVLAIRPAN